MNAKTYSAGAVLRNGQRIRIRALEPRDRADLLDAVRRSGTQSLYRRFFGVKRHFTEKEVTFFVNIDFVSHVALIAETEQDGEQKKRIAGTSRYIVVRPGTAEVAFAVIDEFQGQGIGTLLMQHLVKLARLAGIKELVADVLPENAPMLRIFERCGFRMSTKREQQVVHIILRINEA